MKRIFKRGKKIKIVLYIFITLFLCTCTNTDSNQLGELKNSISKASNGIIIYFEKPDSWQEAWIWFDKNNDGSWETTQPAQAPGDMTVYRNVDGMDWYKKELTNTSSVVFLFNRGDWQKKVDDNGQDFTTTKDIWVRANGSSSFTDPHGNNENKFAVYFKKPNDWGTPNIYSWTGSSNAILGKWPGSVMQDASETEGVNWYKYLITNQPSINIVFNASEKQTSDQMNRSKDGWFVVTGKQGNVYTGKWYDKNPDNNQTYQPNIGPFLTWNEKTAASTGVVVNYESHNTYKGKVEYKKSTDTVWEVPVADNSSTSSTMHHVELKGLDSNTKYDYRIISSDDKKSEAYTFKTGKANDDNYSFIVLGDMQDPGNADQRWSDIAKVVKSEIDNSNIRFILLVGDMAADDEEAHWKTFFDKGKSVFSNTVIMPSCGNHDTPTYHSDSDSTSFKKYFDLPGSKEYYSFSYGNAYFMGLFSELKNDFSEGGVQYKYVQDKLSTEAVDSQWVFSYWHIPPYTIGRHETQQYDFRPITKLFDGVVDWVFSGHVHMFHRFNPLRWTSNNNAPYQPYLAPSGNFGNGSQDGVGYLVLPPAGQWPSTDINKQHYIDEGKVAVYSTFQEIGYVKVSINKNSITIDTYGVKWKDYDNKVYLIDRVRYSK